MQCPLLTQNCGAQGPQRSGAQPGSRAGEGRGSDGRHGPLPAPPGALPQYAGSRPSDRDNRWAQRHWWRPSSGCCLTMNTYGCFVAI